MKRSPSPLSHLLPALKQEADALGLTAAEWANRAGIRQETLSRLRRRPSCDLETIDALARAVGLQLGVARGGPARAEADGLYPAKLTRDLEEELMELCASGTTDPRVWARLGSPFFMAGMAVMLASVPGFDRRAFLELAEALHAGSSRAEVFALWLDGSPLRPSRFLPALMKGLGRAA